MWIISFLSCINKATLLELKQFLKASLSNYIVERKELVSIKLSKYNMTNLLHLEIVLI